MVNASAPYSSRIWRADSRSAALVRRLRALAGVSISATWSPPSFGWPAGCL